MTREEESVLIRVFGETPFTKVLDTLMDHPSYEYTKTELAEVNDISRSTLYGIWDRLEEFDIVEPGKKVGSTQLYKLNTSSELVEQLYKVEQSFMESRESNEPLKA